MDILTILILTIIALAGFPIGLLIKKFTPEELKSGKKWFKLIIIASIIAITFSLIFARNETLVFLFTSFLFIILLTLPSLIKFKKKKKR